ncbi:hypothetical protein BST61_g4317 [Cercospora zeina]
MYNDPALAMLGRSCLQTALSSEEAVCHNLDHFTRSRRKHRTDCVQRPYAEKSDHIANPVETCTVKPL